MTNFDKPYKNYDELIKILEDRNLDISKTSQAKNLLQLYGYHLLINGYGASFIKKNSEEFQSGTSLDDIYSLYLIDSEIQELFLTSVLKIERHMANTIGNVVAEHFDVDNDKEHFNNPNSKEPKKDSYLCYKNYKKPREISLTVKEVIDYLVNSTRKTPDNPSYYYRKNHNHIPPWIWVQNLTFGQIIKYYRIQKPNLKTEIVNEMITPVENENIDYKKELFLSSTLILSCFRNAAAHASPLYIFKAKKHIKKYSPPSKTTLEHYLGSKIFEENDPDSLGKDDLYSALLSLLLLNRDSLQRRLLITKLQSLEQSWKENPSFISDYKEYIKKAGLPNNYIERLTNAHNQLDKNETFEIYEKDYSDTGTVIYSKKRNFKHPLNYFSDKKMVFVYRDGIFHLYENCQHIRDVEKERLKKISSIEANTRKYNLCKSCLAKQKSISK